MRKSIFIVCALIISASNGFELGTVRSQWLTMSPNKKWVAHVIWDTPSEKQYTVAITKLKNHDISIPLMVVDELNLTNFFSWSGDSKCLFFNPNFQTYFLFDIDVTNKLEGCGVSDTHVDGDTTGTGKNDHDITSTVQREPFTISLSNFRFTIDKNDLGNAGMELVFFKLDGTVLKSMEFGEIPDGSELKVNIGADLLTQARGQGAYVLIKSGKKSTLRLWREN